MGKLGTWTCHASREDEESPFVEAMNRKGGWFNGKRIKIMGIEVLRGQAARLLIEGIRLSTHIGLATLVTSGPAMLCALFVSRRGFDKDPRLKDYDADHNAILSEKLKLPLGKMFSEEWKEFKDGLTGEYAGDEGMVGGGDVGGEPAKRQPVGFRDPDHDPRPSAESGWSQEPSDGGNLWERIKRGAGTPASGQKERGGAAGGRGTWGWQQQREQREGSGSMDGDNVTNSSSKQERGSSREDAQRDFDSLVERERRGGESSEGGGGG